MAIERSVCVVMALLFMVIAIAFIPITTADRRNPLKDPRSCGRPECELKINHKFRYNSTIRYKYDYQSHVRTEFYGSGQNTSDVFVKASVYLTFPRTCEGILSIEDVELRDELLPETSSSIDKVENEYDEYGEPITDDNTDKLHPNNDNFGAELAQHILRFSFNDGIITEICPSDDEPNWVLNFKKGILSAMQNSMKRFDIDHNATETDVSGTCDVSYALFGASGTSLSIQKTKDISSCVHRYKTKSVLQTTPYDFRKKYAAWPILYSNSSCNISIDHNVYRDVVCYERHQLVPFSNNQNGVVTESNQRLTLVDESSYQSNDYDNDDLYIMKRLPLLFNHSPSAKPTHGEIKQSRELLKQMCRLGFPNIQRDFIEVFTNFLQTARRLSFMALEQLLARSESICINGRNHILESLPYIGSSASVHLMKNQIIQKGVKFDVVQNWLRSISYLPHPSEDMLQSFYELIVFGESQNDPIYTLSTTAAVHTFCRNNADCRIYSEIQQILDFLDQSLAKEMAQDLSIPRNRQRVIIVLKGIGNIGLVTETLETNLQTIILNKQIPTDVRVEAVKAHRRLDCSNSKHFFLEIYKDFNENSELRIASYLQAMQCPDYISIKAIKYVLTAEEVNQVGSFVWSHLTNLAKSASPVNVEAQGLLVQRDLDSKYKLDIRKFSRNFEQSLFFDEYNIGATSDVNLIFGTDSYMPRSASWNFTTDLFGESINLFEISTRMEGFEHMIESIFGPKGSISTKTILDQFGKFSRLFRDTINLDEYDNFDRNERKKRDVDEEEEELDEADRSDRSDQHRHQNISDLEISAKAVENDINNLNYDLNYNYDKPRAAFSMKVFGNDIQYKSIEGINEITNILYQLNPQSLLKNIFSGKEITYTKSGVFMDASYDVPLACGFPLSIHAFGASSVDLRMSGQFNGNFQKTIDINLQGKIKPSVSVDIIGSMESDYFYGSSGVRIKSNLYSSSALDVDAKVNGSNSASVRFKLPQDRNDIFSARSELLVLHREQPIKQKGIDRRSSNSTCTWPVIDRAVGLKICADYSLPDVSDPTTASPSLLVSGPVNVSFYLNKADLTAKTFLFEYQWKSARNSSSGSIVFHTPESTIPRILMANITTDPNHYNLSMSFHNGDMLHSAVGSYENTRDNKRIEVYLNLDGNKNFALEMETTRTELKYGWNYYPKFKLTVNDDVVAGLTGQLRATSKKGILQYDVVLNFETKKLKTKLSGYIIQTDVSVSTKLKMEYMFLDNKTEIVEFDGEISDRSQRARTEYLGALKLNSTAYKQFSFASNFSFVSLLGHVETNININNAPDLIDPDYTCGIRLMFARFTNFDTKTDSSRSSIGSSTEALVEIKRPRSKLDWKLLIRYEERTKKGFEHNAHLELQYAPDRKITGAVSILFPHGPLFAIDVAINIVVPTFEPCVVSLKLIEKESNEYNIDFKGTIFTGHSLSLRGKYKDRSSAIKKNHHLKIFVKSPHFEDTDINLRYWRDEYQISFNLHVDYAKQPYGLLIQYSERQENNITSCIELKLKDKIYSIRGSLMLEQPKLISIDLHLDKARDIHLLLKSLSTDAKKEYSVELQWDANRDPTEKLAISIEYNRPNYKTYDGNFLITYPERSLNGAFDLYTGGPTYQGKAHIGWNSQESIQVHFNAGTRPGEVKDMWFLIRLLTPFDGWTTNGISGGWYYYNNLLLANGSLEWADNQNLAIAVLGDYKIADPVFGVEFKIDLNSTIRDVPTAGVHIKHAQDGTSVTTLIHLKHFAVDEKSHEFAINSSWKINPTLRHLDGFVRFITPFESYRTGMFSTKIELGRDKELGGAAYLDIERRRFTITVDGYARKFTDVWFVTNITTPIDKFTEIICRFGIVERDKHFVAEVRTPERALGIELLYQVTSFAEFNIKFNLETPIEAFERILFIGKYNTEMVEFKGGWNKILMGYIGVWRIVDFTDFELSYKVFTPLENLTENGFVAKLVKKDDFDMELSLKIGKYKVGTVLNAKPKPKILRRLVPKYKDIVSSILLDEKQLFKQILTASDDADEEEPTAADNADETDDLLNLIGNMELDILVWPTITGTVDIEEFDDTYFASGTVKLPMGNVEFKDIFYEPDLLNMKNSLHVTTPFKVAPEMTVLYIHSVEFGLQYIGALEMSVFNEKWMRVGASSNYTKTIEESDTYDMAIGVLTPISSLPAIRIKGNMEIEDNTIKGNLSMQANETSLSFGINYETDENFMDVSFGVKLNTPVVPDYATRLYFKKDLSATENTINLGFDVHENGSFNTLRIDALWNVNNPHSWRINGNVETTFIPIQRTEIALLFARQPAPLASIRIGYKIENHMFEIVSKATRKGESVTIELKSPIKGFENLSLQGLLYRKAPEPDVYTIQGNMYKNDEVHTVEGLVTLHSDVPIEIQLKLKSLSRNTEGFLKYSFNSTEGGYGKTFQLKVWENDKFLQIGGGYSVLSKLKWNVMTAIQTSDGILSMMPAKNNIDFKASIEPGSSDNFLGNFEFTSPWRLIGVDSMKLNAELQLHNRSIDLYSNYEFGHQLGRSFCSWAVLLSDNIYANVIMENQFKPRTGDAKVFNTALKYISNKFDANHQYEAGINLNINNLWSFGTNVSLQHQNAKQAKILAAILLPHPYKDVHSISGEYRSALNVTDLLHDIAYNVEYRSELAQVHVASRGHVRNQTDLNGFIHFDCGQQKSTTVIEANVEMKRMGPIRREIIARLATPYHVDDTLAVSGSYDARDYYHLYGGRIYYPSKREVASGNIEFASLSNMKGHINCTNPLQNITRSLRNVTWLQSDFDFTTTGTNSIRYLKVTWPKDSALFNLRSSFQSHNTDRDLQGTIKIEVPLASRHYADINYNLEERQQITNGQCTIDWNRKQVLNGKYTSRGESRAGYEKQMVNVTLENEKMPIGINYIHVMEQMGNSATVYDMKHAEVYELQKRKAFNLTGELHITTSETGQGYKIIAIHPNRTVIFSSEYDFKNSTSMQRSKIQLAPNIWLAYDVKLENLTNINNDSQFFNLQLSYPRRNLSTEGSYSVTDTAFESDVSFKWTYVKPSPDLWNSDDNNNNNKQPMEPEQKAIRAIFKWNNENPISSTETNHTATFTIKHNSFDKDVEFKGFFYRSPVDLVNSKVYFDYCDSPDHLLLFEFAAKDLMSLVKYRNYTIQLMGEHKISDLDLGVDGSVGVRPGLYNLTSTSRYKRGYLPMQEGSLIAFADQRNNEIYYQKLSPHKTFKIWAKAKENYPIYSINASYEDSPDINSTSRFYMDLDEKLVRLSVNMTPDASQNLQMIGYISDARNGFFDLYRDYEDIRVIDISYYLRMNHSRLVTSQLLWRPKIKDELKAKVKSVTTSMYDSMSENIDFWIKTTYTETLDTVTDIWTNAKPEVQGFLDDISDLKIIEEDLQEFRTFLNQSYEANDFYVKTAVNFTMSILDELAIRNHIHSLPKVLNEIWQALGDSGQVLHQSILRFIENLKMSYKKAVEFISKIFHGEALENVSILMENAVKNYDRFMKDLHLSLIKYVENVWNRISDTIISYWNKFLQRIEPSIFKIAQQLESVLWNWSKEILDFLYKRTNEIVASPYFNTVANFTQDLDRLYTDIMSNDALTNIKKYTDLTIEFLKEEYFKVIPFGKELHNVITEVTEEIKELQKLEAVQFVIQRIEELKTKLKWLADEFHIENRMERVWQIIRRKLNNIAMTALEMDDKYREAKTKFIFDPDTGVMELEQKLPMSWHAFNETPHFEEIPEYKMLQDVQLMFTISNYSFWNLYYDVKPYLDLNLWLPPYKSAALLSGSRHLVTFDKRYISLNSSRYITLDGVQKSDQCSYLLAHDYVDSNFTLVMVPTLTKNGNKFIGSKSIALLVEGKLFEINVIRWNTKGNNGDGGSESLTLPIRIGDTVVYQEANLLIIESSRGFQLTCNLEFDMCLFELTGWYFGKTSGLLGNMNNEKYDDYITPTKMQNDDDQAFIDSWRLQNCTKSISNPAGFDNASSDVTAICDGYFRSKISNFASCFGVVDPIPFYEMCLDLGMNSYGTVLNSTQPIQRGTCTAALSYIETCAQERTLIRIPNKCINCQLINGTYVPEGKFVKFTGDDIPQTTDVVFIVEAKPCNQNFTTQKNLNAVVSTMEKEFNLVNLTNNRYAVVAFGGAAPFDKPRSIVYNNEIFTSHENVKYFFDHIVTRPNNVSDIFDAISVAFKLIFRPAASKTFILIPCSTCNASFMRLDYSSVLQVMLEEGINLHILMDPEFSLEKKRLERILFGIDRENAFTKKYLKDSTGDKDIRRNVKLPKGSLGLCAPLALESNGTIFTTRKLRPGSRHPTKKVATVFAKRVAATAKPSRCQLCECTGHNTGASYMACTHCHFPNPSSLDYGFTESEMTAMMQTDEDFSWEMNDDEELS